MQRLTESRIYDFGEFRLDAKRHRLFLREGHVLVPLTPKAVDLLIALVQSKGRVLTKDELLDTVWGGSFVEEANLSQTIFVLRKTLGENTKEPRFILTVPNRGYQFISSVTEFGAEDTILEDEYLTDIHASDPKPTETSSREIKSRKLVWVVLPAVLFLAVGAYWFFRPSRPAELSQIKAIAILPFEDASSEQTEKYLGVGLADALVNRFSSLKQITVRPTRTVAKYAANHDDVGKIGRELQVDAVLDGRIQRVGDRVRISVQLIRAADNTTIWTENFDDHFTNFLAVQDSISQRVVRSLSLQLNESESAKLNQHGTAVPEAYEAYLRGRYFWNKRTADGFQHAVQDFTTAIELDPNFALAHCGLAETYVLVNLFGTKHDPNAFPMARISAERALALDPNLADAHAALAQVKLQYEFDWPGTENEYLKAIELEENNAVVRQWYGEFLALVQRTDESVVQMEKARDLDPTSLSANNAMALPLLRAGDIDGGLAVTEKVLEMDPNFSWALHYRSRGFLLKGDLPSALDCAQRAVTASDGSIFMRANLAYMLARSGRQAEARKILSELETYAKTSYVSPYNFAMIHNGLGETRDVYKYLEQAIDQRDFLTISLKGDTDFQNLHNDPQFAAVLHRVNLD